MESQEWETEQLLRLIEKGDAFQTLWGKDKRQEGIEGLAKRGWERGWEFSMKKAKR